jgi:Cdc6-like AAA superfamily ATPase
LNPPPTCSSITLRCSTITGCASNLSPHPPLHGPQPAPDWIGGQPYQETKAKPLYFLKDRTASLYLYGPVGSGKTSLLRLIAQEMHGDPEANVFSLLFD